MSGTPGIPRLQAGEDVKICDPLLLMVCEASREDFMEHLRAAHPQEHAREQAKELEMNAALADLLPSPHVSGVTVTAADIFRGKH